MKASIATAAAFACIAAAAPAPAKLAIRDHLSDADILNYALTLEHLEDKFYREGLSKFSQSDFAAAGYDATYYGNLKTVSFDETTHVAFLTKAITAAGYKPVAECVYKFPYTDVKSFLATASVLEGVGVSAYLGAAASIVSDDYLTAAGSILTVEARHSSYIRAGNKQVPFPQAFDAPLTFNQVYTLAAQFIVSCPESNPALPLMPFPVLTATSKQPMIEAGTTIHLTSKAKKLPKKVYAAFITVTGPIFAEAKPSGKGYKVVVPKDIAGQNYVVLTKSMKMVTDDTIVSGPAIVEIAGSAIGAAS